MGTNLSVYRALVNERAPAFAGAMTWHANGKRGHLHASTSCSKLRKHGVVTVSLSLRTALDDHTVCESCIHHGHYDRDQRESFQLARTILDVERQTGQNPGDSYTRYPAIVAARTRRLAEALLDTLQREQDLHGLDRWFDRVRDRITDSMPAMPSRTELDAEILRVVVPRLLNRKFVHSELDPGFWGGRKIIEILGGDHEGRHAYSGHGRNTTPIAFFTRAWLDKLSEGHSPAEATKLLLANDAIFDLMSPPDQRQLEHCSVALDAVEGESLWQFAERTWRHQVLEALRVAAQAMTDRYETLTAPKDAVLIGSWTTGLRGMRRSAIGDNVENVVGGLQHLVGNDERVLAVCDPTVADFLVGRNSYGGWTQPVALDQMPTEDVLETAVTLWEPRNSYSSYEKLPAALTAARAL